MAAITVSATAEEALECLISTEPHLYLSPSPELSGAARLTCSHLFSSLLPLCPKPPPLDRLLAGKDFDAEQIWGQIDEMSRPLVSMLRRELKRLEREPPVPHATVPAAVKDGKSEEDEEEDDEDEDEEAAVDEDGDEEDEDDEDDEEEADAGNDENGGGVEDRFLKIKELEEYLVEAEAKEYGHSEPRKRREKGEDDGDEDEEDEDEEDEDEDEDDDDLEYGGFDGDDNQETDVGESARYDDFFGSKRKKSGDKTDIGIKKAVSSKKVKFTDELEDFEMDDEHDHDDEEEDEGQEDDEDTETQDAVLSTHEKELQKLHSRIEQMEKANMEPKSWTMLGEVTAAKRPQNSALEVDLDFEHNTRPAPVITEEVTASIEDLIKKRINEDHFDDVQKAPVLPSKAPKELKELDENKSKKGLAEIYEEEYAQKAGLVSIPLSSSDEQKKEATILFKNLCMKLDALSHFHFAPKPIIEDMSIQTNVPALAMEEIAPLAVSDASMLAPEEIFEGKGDIKEEVELTQEERKRRRANKKRKHRAGEAKRSAKRGRAHTDPGHLNGSEI